MSAERESEGWDQTGRRGGGGLRRREGKATQKTREKESRRKMFHSLPPEPPSPDRVLHRRGDTFCLICFFFHQ